MQTKVFPGKFEGTLSVWAVDEDGEKKGEYPLFSMGKKKLKAVVTHIKEIKEFIGAKDEN